MGLLSSMFRLVSSMFGLAQGGTERATDKMLTSSPDTIRNQFRKTREDWTHEYNEMRDAVAQLCQIRDDKVDEAKKLGQLAGDMNVKMQGAIAEYKKNQNEAMKELYVKFASNKEDSENKIRELAAEVKEQEDLINTYKTKLQALKTDIENLKKEEAETVADIVSSKKMKELNNKLQGLSSDTQTKNLEAIRDARKQLRSSAKLSAELSGLNSPETDIENKLITSGKATKFLGAFDEATKLDRIFVEAEEVIQIPARIPSDEQKQITDMFSKIQDTHKKEKSKKFAESLGIKENENENEKVEGRSSKKKLDDLF